MADEKHEHGCDCGCEDEDVVMLQDDEGNDIPFHYIATIEYEGKDYVYLQEDTDDEDAGEVEIFELNSVEKDGEAYDELLPIDDELYEKLYQKLLELADSECEDEDCDCHHHHDDCDCK